MIKPYSEDDDVRIKRLRNGDWSFGCQGRHNGNGTSECPFESHHHHDEFCKLPSNYELKQLGFILTYLDRGVVLNLGG